MGKLAEYMARKRDLASDYEHELRAVRNLILGVTRLSGSECTIDLAATEGFVAGSRARAAFLEALHASVHDALVAYAHDLAREGLDRGMSPDVVGMALNGSPPPQPAVAAPDASSQGPNLRLVACA